MLLAQVMEFPASLVTFLTGAGLPIQIQGFWSDSNFEKAFLVLFITKFLIR